MADTVVEVNPDGDIIIEMSSSAPVATVIEAQTTPIVVAPTTETVEILVVTGQPGPANNLAVGSVTVGPAAASITGASPNQVLNLVLPSGGVHTHTAANISDSTATGRSVLTAVDAAGARAAIGAGTSSLVIGTTSSTAKAGNYTPPDAAAATKGLIKLAGDLGGTADFPTVVSQADRAYVRSFAATDLVANGTAYLGDNTNFSMFTLDKTDSPIGGGSFDSPVGVSGVYRNDELIPVDLSRRYLLRFFARQKAVGPQCYLYGFLSPFDIEGLSIAPQHYMFQNNTTTTLASALAPGATTVSLTSAANWNNAAGSSTHLRKFIVWNFTDALGKLWGPETYSRKGSPSDIYADGAISGNTITLRAPFDPTAWGYPAGYTIPAGTSLSNGSSGGTYMYGSGMSNVILSNNWTLFEAPFSGGVYAKVNGGRAVSADANTGFPPGTAFAKVGWLLNLGTGGTGNVPGSRASVASVSLSDATRSEYEIKNATRDSVPNTIAKRDPVGDVIFNNVYAGNAAGAGTVLTRKDYVDGQNRFSPRTFTGTSHTLEPADERRLIYAQGSGSPVNITLPLNADFAAPFGYTVEVLRASADAYNIIPPSGVILIGPDGLVGPQQIRSTFGLVRLRKYAQDSWSIEGDLDIQIGTPNATANTVVRRDGNAWVQFGSIGINNAPATADQATRKDYVDTQVATRIPAFADPNADRMVFWDDSASAFAPLTASTGLTITGTNMTVRTANETQTGIVELATAAETTTGTDNTRAVHPAGLKVELDKKATLVHTHGVVDLTATGTKDATTFLRGDNTWAVPSGGGTVTAANITDATVVGRNVLTAIDAPAARTAIGAGTSNLAIGTSAGTAKAGDYQPVAANISDLTEAVQDIVGEQVIAGTNVTVVYDDATGKITVAATGGTGGTTVIPATIFVAASTASAAEKTLAGPTYTCDGTADDVQIQAAINAIKAAGGGWVLLSAGDFNLAARLTISGNSDENQRKHIGLRGAGPWATNIKPGAGLVSAIHLTNCVTTSLCDFTVTVAGNTSGITSAADHVNAAASHKSFWMSSFKNIEIWGDFSGTGTGWGLDLDSPFRTVFENIDVTGTRNGARLYSSHDAFNPGNCVFNRCFMSIFGSNGFAWKVESTVAVGKMNIIEFLMCEGISFNGTGNTAVWLGGVGPVNNTRWRSSNLEQFDTLFHVQRGEDNVMDGDYWDVRTGAAANTTAFVRFDANAWNNRVSIGNALTKVATRLVLAAAATSPSMPNLVEHVKLIVDTGGSVTNSIATPASVVSRWIIAEGVNASSASTVVVTPNREVAGTGIANLVKITQAAYDALGTKDGATIYAIQG